MGYPASEFTQTPMDPLVEQSKIKHASIGVNNDRIRTTSKSNSRPSSLNKNMNDPITQKVYSKTDNKKNDLKNTLLSKETISSEELIIRQIEEPLRITLCRTSSNTFSTNQNFDQNIHDKKIFTAALSYIEKVKALVNIDKKLSTIYGVYENSNSQKIKKFTSSSFFKFMH